MLGQLTREKETDRGLDLSRSDGVALVVASETTSLLSDALEDVVHERVHDSHGLVRDAGVGMHLLENLVDVARVARVRTLVVLLSSCGTLGLGDLKYNES